MLAAAKDGKAASLENNAPKKGEAHSNMVVFLRVLQSTQWRMTHLLLIQV